MCKINDIWCNFYFVLKILHAKHCLNDGVYVCLLTVLCLVGRSFLIVLFCWRLIRSWARLKMWGTFFEKINTTGITIRRIHFPQEFNFKMALNRPSVSYLSKRTNSTTHFLLHWNWPPCNCNRQYSIHEQLFKSSSKSPI